MNKRNGKFEISVLLSLTVLFTSFTAKADNIPDAAQQWMPGNSSNQNATKATFALGVTADNKKSFGSAFETWQSLDVLADMRIAPKHVGKNGSQYVVIRLNKKWYMKNSSGTWLKWDGQLTNLVSHINPRSLQATESIVVQQKLNLLRGNFQVYVGYGIDGVIYYNAQPDQFSVIIKERPGTIIPILTWCVSPEIWLKGECRIPILTLILFKLNDTGITFCADDLNSLGCPVNNYPGQDAQSGRDVTDNDNSDGHAGFSFTKFDAGVLPASASVWNCVQDNVTNLMWEVKTNDYGLHDKDWTYTWYEPNNSKNGGNAGTQNGGSCGSTSQCDTHAYVQAVNAKGWCGYNDWRMPTANELSGIASLDRVNPAIDTDYFPNSLSAVFWSSSANADSSNDAWVVSFSNGSDGRYYGKNDVNQVRLVRSGQ